MVSADLFAMAGVTSGPVSDWWKRVMFSQNPPEHTRLRSLVSRVFTPRAVARLRPGIRARAEEIVRPAAEAGVIDAQGDFGHRLPLAVMSDLLAVPEADRAMFGEWTSTLGLAFGAIADPSTRVRVEDALAQLDAFVRALIDERGARPGDDLLSALIEVREGSDRLDEDELVALVENLLFAGHDTTRGALAAMVTLLARHPDQYRAVVEDPHLARGAVEEVLRYEPISFGTARLAAQESEIAGVTIPAGTAVGLCLVSAARDPRRYTDPQSFDVRRDEGLTPAFGAGIHYCVGAALARAEMEEALAVLVEHASALTPESEPQWVPFASIRHYRPPVLVALAP
jgi:cytochrome P450